jgi:hypothetical protein
LQLPTHLASRVLDWARECRYGVTRGSIAPTPPASGAGATFVRRARYPHPPAKSRMLEARSAGKCNKFGFEVRIQFSTHRLYPLTMFKHVVLATVRFPSPPATTTTTHDWKSWYTQVSPDAELHVAGLAVCDDGSQYGSALWAAQEVDMQNQQDRFVSNWSSGRSISTIV